MSEHIDPGFDLDGTDLRPFIRAAQPDLLPRPAPDAGPKIVVPVRLAPDVIGDLKALAGQRGLGYTTLAAQLIEAAVAELTADEQATVTLADVRRVIAQLARGATPPAA